MTTNLVPSATPLALENYEGVFCDAFVQHQQLVFLSLWGYSSRIMALYGAITDGELPALHIDGTHYPVVKGMLKQQIRMPKDSRYGSEMVHAMLYADITVGDNGHQRILLGDTDDDAIWRELGQLSEIGLLPHWQPVLLPILREQGFICCLDSRGISAVLLDLSKQQAYECLLSELVKGGQLTASREDA